MPIDDQDCPELTCCNQNLFVGECCQPKPFDYSSQQYCNTEQSYTASCPEGLCGDPVTVTVPPNAFCSSVSQDDANAQALAAAQAQADEELECVECDDTGECEVIVYDSVTPTIESDAVTYFNSGFHWPAGNYRVEYIEGALKYNPAFNWGLNDSTAHCFRVVHNNGTASIMGPALDFQRFATQALLEAHNTGQVVEFVHTGGTIGVFLDDFPYEDNIAGDPNPTFRLSKICGEVESCGGSDAIIEQAMRAMQERQYVVSGVFIDWPDSTISGDPGNYPVDGFYDSDIAASADPDARRAELIQSISDVLDNSWLGSYFEDGDLDGAPTLEFLSVADLPPLTVTAENYEESLETLRGYCCQLQFINAPPIQINHEQKLGDTTSVTTNCVLAQTEAEDEYALAPWLGVVDTLGLVETTTADGGGNISYVLQRGRFTKEFDLTLLTSGIAAVFLRIVPFNGNLIHSDQAPQPVDSLFHRTEGNPDLGNAAWESPLVFSSDAGIQTELGCPGAGTGASGGWHLDNDDHYLVQVFKSNNPAVGHWTYYP